MNQHILITGATGMLGEDLIQALTIRGHQVSVLVRKPQQIKHTKVYLWDVYKGEIDVACLTGVDTIIHLAGENISKEKWTEQRKKEIIDSRVLSARLLFKTLANHKNQVKSFISAAATGYYGDSGEEIVTETAVAGRDFLANSCIQWEAAADEGIKMGLRVVKLRTGVVLSKADGALHAMAKPVKFFAGAPLGSGKQWVSWIHMKDIINIYIHSAEHKEIQGTFNACAPFPVTNKTLTKAIAKSLHRPVWPFSIPEKAMKIILGEMSAIVLNSNNVSAQKILDTGFIFNYTTLDEALAAIYR